MPTGIARVAFAAATIGRGGRRELSGVLQEALAELPDAYREVLRLYDLECRGVSEVAQRLRCSPGAVYMRRSRAQEMLRGILGAFSHYL